MNTTTNYRWFTSVHGIQLPVNMKLIGIDFPWILKYCSRFTFNKWNESTTVITMEQNDWSDNNLITDYNDVIMGAMVSQISSLVIVYSTVCLFRRSSKKTSKLRVTGLCEGNSPVTGDFPAQMASNTENVSIFIMLALEPSNNVLYHWRNESFLYDYTSIHPQTLRQCFNPLGPVVVVILFPEEIYTSGYCQNPLWSMATIVFLWWWPENAGGSSSWQPCMRCLQMHILSNL